jgi:hypothetical protein
MMSSQKKKKKKKEWLMREECEQKHQERTSPWLSSLIGWVGIGR